MNRCFSINVSIRDFWLFAAGLVFLLQTQISRADWVERTWNGMGTRIHVEIWQEDDALAERLIDAVNQEMVRIEALMSTYMEASEVSRVNREAAGTPVKITEELFDLLRKAERVSQLSDGAFDITYASVGRYYDYRKKLAPDEAQINLAIDAIDYRHVVLNDTDKTVFFTQPHVYIDLGGIAKGYAVDHAITLLKEGGVTSGLVSAGGDTRIIGSKLGRPWIVGVKDPRAEDRNAVMLPLENTAISTSGDYERFFIQDGVRYHHIISPKTGKSAGEVQSVTIIGPDATTTDALSTTIFVMGVEKGLALINRLNGIDCIIVDQQRKLHYSKDLQPPG